MECHLRLAIFYKYFLQHHSYITWIMCWLFVVTTFDINIVFNRKHAEYYYLRGLLSNFSLNKIVLTRPCSGRPIFGAHAPRVACWRCLTLKIFPYKKNESDRMLSLHSSLYILAAYKDMSRAKCFLSPSPFFFPVKVKKNNALRICCIYACNFYTFWLFSCARKENVLKIPN